MNLVFDPLFSGLYLGEFNIDTGTEITHAVDAHDLHRDTIRALCSNCVGEGKGSSESIQAMESDFFRTLSQFRVNKPSLSLILPDGAHQVVQDSFLNILPLGEWVEEDLDSQIGKSTNSSLLSAMDITSPHSMEGTCPPIEEQPKSPLQEKVSMDLTDGESPHQDPTPKEQLLQKPDQQSDLGSPMLGLENTSVASQTKRHVKLFGYLVYKQMQKMNIKRNARVKALMFVSNSKSCIYLKNALVTCLNEIFAIDFLEEEKTIEEKNALVREMLMELFTALVSIQNPTSNDILKSVHVSASEAHCFSEVLQRRQYALAKFSFRQNPYTLKICKTLIPNSVDSSEVSIIKLIDKFQEKVMLLFNCILFERKCVILGHNIPASEISNLVLASALMLPVLPEKHFLHRRFFPYVSFLEMDDVLGVSGFVVGTTNPIFIERPEWYDCLCNLNTGTISISCPEQMVEIVPDDQSFIQNVIFLISVMRQDQRNSTQKIEHTVQSLFHQYALDLYRGTWLMNQKKIPGWEDFDASQWQEARARMVPNISKAYAFKLHLLQKTRSCRLWKKVLEERTPRSALSMIEEIQLLRNAKLSDDDIFLLFGSWIQRLKTREQVIHFLNYFPESKGGLEPLFMPLFHSNPMIRFTAMTLIQTLEQYREGSLAISNCNFFLVVHYGTCQKSFTTNN